MPAHRGLPAEHRYEDKLWPRRWLLALLGLAVLVATVGAPFLAAAPATAFQPGAELAAPAAEPAGFNAQLAYAHVEALASTIGMRAAGTPGEQQAADYIQSTLESYGYKVERQPFNYYAFEDRGTTLAMTRPESRTLEAVAATYSRAGQLSAPLVDAGLARRQDLADLDLHGKVALARRGEIRFAEKVRNAADSGAAAVIIFNNEPGNLQGSLASASAVPTATVSGETGQALLDALASGPVEVRLDVQTVAEYRPSFNIVARWPGSGPPKVIIGGHYDSVAAGPGANDNASGIAVMLESARVMAGTPGVAFIAFGAEELGLFGSQDYANKMSAADQDALWAVLNLDMVGWDGGILLAERYGSVSLKLQNRILGVAADLGIPINGGVSDGGSDHVPFANRGIPAVHFWTGMDPFNHSSGDTLDKINPASLEAAGRVVVETAYRLVQ